jgi:putative membrane protein insertion efficiency factor
MSAVAPKKPEGSRMFHATSIDRLTPAPRTGAGRKTVPSTLREEAPEVDPADRRRVRALPGTARARDIVALPVRLYRFFLAPLLPSCCRFYPTCSEYALEALMTHGALRGGWLALCRLLRCSPACRGGFDPVPPPHRSSFRDIYGQ